MADWITKLRSTNHTAQLNIDEEFEKVKVLKAGEAAIMGSKITDKNGATPTIVCREDGNIELFASSRVGIRINPKMETISLVAPNIELHGNVVDINTRELMGLRWNKKPLNLSETLLATSSVGPVSIFPGTLLPYDSSLEDATMKAPKILKGLIV